MLFLLIYLLKSICSSGSRGCCAASPSLRRGKSPLSSVLILVRPRHTGIPSSPMRMRKRNVQMQPHNWQCFIHSGLKRALKMACLCLSVLTQQRPPSYDDDNGDAAECWMADTYEPFISLFAGWLDGIHCYWPPVLLHLIMPVFYAFSLVFLLP